MEKRLWFVVYCFGGVEYERNIGVADPSLAHQHMLTLRTRIRERYAALTREAKQLFGEPERFRLVDGENLRAQT